MEQLENIKTLILPVLDSLGIQLYDLKWVNEKKSRILQIAVMRADGSMDIDTCALVSEKISEALDAHDDWISFEYFLEVCSRNVNCATLRKSAVRWASMSAPV